jgi:hypothetical protein
MPRLQTGFMSTSSHEFLLYNNQSLDRMKP